MLQNRNKMWYSKSSNSPLVGRNGNQMSRSSRKNSSSTTRSTTRRSTRPVSSSTPTIGTGDRRRATSSRRLRYYTFQYNRDDVTHGRGSNSVRITDRSYNGSVELTLQEARSLYNFLQNQFDGR